MSWISLFLISLAGTTLTIGVLRPVASRLGLVDLPDARKVHEGAIPLVGGIAIYVGIVMGLLFVGLDKNQVYLLIAGGLVMVVGVVDDIHEISPLMRLVPQVISAVIMAIGAGVVVTSVGDIIIPGRDLGLGWMSVPFTVFATAAMINAVNMSDGLDGLAGMQLLIPFAGLATVAGLAGDIEHLRPLVAVCAGLVGFLAFNLRHQWRHRASVFLGDSGSNLLGFVYAWFLIAMTQEPTALVPPVAVLWFSLLLIYDTVEVVARRLVRGKSPFEADSEHLHHVFILAGFSVTEATFTMSALTLIGVMVGVTSAFVDISDSVFFVAFVLFGLLFMRMIFRTWRVMRFLQRSICRRRNERRSLDSTNWSSVERRKIDDRRKNNRSTRSKKFGS